MTYQIIKSRRKSEDIVQMDLAGHSGTLTVVTSVDFVGSSYTYVEVSVSDGVIKTVGDEQTVS